MELKDQLQKKYNEVEELYDQQARDHMDINSLQLQCKEGERMIQNLRDTVNKLMAEAEMVRSKRTENLKVKEN